MTKKLIWALLWTLFIIIGSSLSGNTLQNVSLIPIPYFDKFIHFVWYMMLYIFWYGYFLEKTPSSAVQLSRRLFLIIAIVSFGLIIEILQENIFINRSFEIIDIAVNFIGTITGFLLFFYLYQHKITGRYL